MCEFRYLDNVVNKQTVAPPIPHLHALLTSGDDPPPEVDIFDLIKSSYEVRIAHVCCSYAVRSLTNSCGFSVRLILCFFKVVFVFLL